MVGMALAGLLGSLVADIQDLSNAYMDAAFLRQLQATDQQKKAMANGTAKHGADGRRSPDDDVAHVTIFLLVNVLVGTF
jgi:hypothetical protein